MQSTVSILRSGTPSQASGSVRYPASLNGLTALKPTWGRLPTRGSHPLAPDLDTVGPLCRTAADLREIFAILDTGRTAEHGRHRDLSGLRTGVDRELVGRRVSPEIVQALHDVLARMLAGGAVEVPIGLPPTDEPLEAQIALRPSSARRSMPSATRPHRTTSASSPTSSRMGSGDPRTPRPAPVPCGRGSTPRWRGCSRPSTSS
jgi:Asp-tRNA(Asn)/Glu-tRNA(Gln) amidotransferase A subunit family amidase